MEEPEEKAAMATGAEPARVALVAPCRRRGRFSSVAGAPVLGMRGGTPLVALFPAALCGKRYLPVGLAKAMTASTLHIG